VPSYRSDRDIRAGRVLREAMNDLDHASKRELTPAGECHRAAPPRWTDALPAIRGLGAAPCLRTAPYRTCVR
jgi:hypothetical protein